MRAGYIVRQLRARGVRHAVGSTALVLSSKCGQRHVERRWRRLKTDLFSIFYIHSRCATAKQTIENFGDKLSTTAILATCSRMYDIRDSKRSILQSCLNLKPIRTS